MKILSYRKGNKWCPGIVTEKGVLDVYGYYRSVNRRCDFPFTIQTAEEWKGLVPLMASHGRFLLKEEDLVAGPCVPEPGKIICVGLNYRKHAAESGMAAPAVPVLFPKYRNALTDYGTAVPLGEEGCEFDYEVELGVVIGRKGKNIPHGKALDYVLGYCVANDLSCRDLQFTTSQWLLGKSLDHFLPLGKYLVTADEVGDPQDLQLACFLNGELRQNSSTADMIFSVAQIIAYVSRFISLEPGDLILTGTPEGVIMGRADKQWLKHGDTVRVEIEKLGSSENLMTSANG
jgi:2-keto-4-pentenoate hydratase/2-oxohepta-3-ene-1,7-dioic acid hydratase in catechol pathway